METTDPDISELALVRFPREAEIWQAIKHTLKPGQQSFSDFFMFFGECPPGCELRAKRDGKRAPFELDHFEWLPIGTPRRIDTALRRPNGLQEQINELRSRIEALEKGE